MVQGVTRRVIVIKSPDPKLFEEAIFIVSGESTQGVTGDDLIAQAQQVASSYIRQNLPGHRSKRWPPMVFLLIGAAMTGLAWALAAIFL